MTRLFFICALCGGLVLRGHAQSIDAWIEQLAALQTLQRTIRQGYAIMSNGTQAIVTIRDQEYQLHDHYFTSLDRVQPTVLNDPRVQALRSRLHSLLEELQSALAYWRKQPILSP